MKHNELLRKRDELLGVGMPTFYQEPVHVVRGEGVWLWDNDGRKFLDCYNNVPHVGHCHPHVVDAICRQASTLNTHTRYLHEGILEYVERLTATFANHLSSAVLVCSGSEANDVAMRMAQSVTGNTGFIATDHTYHGNTAAVSQLSTRMPPIGGHASHVRHVPAPDSLRPLGGESGAGHARAFADAVGGAIEELQAAGHELAALVVCPFFANEGFPDVASGFLDGAVQRVRAAGGIIIADEVQPGFGRLGTHMWGHQRIGVQPEIVTLGKPMGNGHPVAGIVTSAETLDAFRRAFRYFNTFGGNPVACAAAMAVLDVLEQEQLMENARVVGDYAREGLQRLADSHECIAEVRGSGLFFGAEMVLDRGTLAPATAFVDRVVNAMRDRGVLLNKLGIHANALKIRPPMPFGRAEVDLMLDALHDVLRVTPLEPV